MNGRRRSPFHLVPRAPLFELAKLLKTGSEVGRLPTAWKKGMPNLLKRKTRHLAGCRGHFSNSGGHRDKGIQQSRNLATANPASRRKLFSSLGVWDCAEMKGNRSIAFFRIR